MSQSPNAQGRFIVLPVGLTILTLCLIVLGATVRAVGAGLSCPDWPLCNGQLIPSLEGGVFYEWLHRLVALTVSTCFLIMLFRIASQRALRTPYGKLAALAVVLLAIQVVLGGLTVLHLLNASVVTLHLATGTLLFGVFLLIALRRLACNFQAHAEQPRGLTPVAVMSLALVYGQILLGGGVAANYASLACPDWPSCVDGIWWPPFVGGVGLHMTHRLVAYSLFLMLLWLVAIGRRSPDRLIRGSVYAIVALVSLQLVLGVANVLLRIPVPLTAAHNGVAELLFACLLGLNFLLRTKKVPTDVLPTPTEVSA